MAQLTPRFISTLFMLPEHLQYFDPAAAPGAQNAPLTNFIDLLIVDEASQVSPEIGASALALANRALIIGDIHQIEPVWSVGPEVDYGTLKSVGLLEFEFQLEAAGPLGHNGSLMKLARRVSAFTRNDEEGLFLSEHRRCQTPIIEICNELVYKGRLVPCTPAFENPVLPALGWANIRSRSITGAGSRSNPDEAEAVTPTLRYRESLWQKA
jgi:superfamily I DNA and/or RNA helicase